MTTLRRMWAFLSDSHSWYGRDGIIHLTTNHLKLSLVAVVLAAAIAIPPAVWLGHVRRGGVVASAVVNIGRALPTYGIVALMFPFALRMGWGLGFWPTLPALVLLGIPPMFTNAYTGVRNVAPDVVEAARGMGMRAAEVVRKVELPAALPLIATGVRVSAVQVVATTTLGALVGFPCLGTLIIQGKAERGGSGKLLAGGVLVALLSLATELAFAALERRLTPWVVDRRRGRQRDITIAAPHAAPAPA
jgi:osmoprotectant transport system permease protein